MQGYKFRNLFQLCERMNVIQSIISNNYYSFLNLNSIEKIEDELDRIAKYEYVLYWIGTKWLRALSLSPNDNIRNHLIANPIDSFTAYLMASSKKYERENEWKRWSKNIIICYIKSTRLLLKHGIYIYGSEGMVGCVFDSITEFCFAVVHFYVDACTFRTLRRLHLCVSCSRRISYILYALWRGLVLLWQVGIRKEISLESEGRDLIDRVDRPRVANSFCKINTLPTDSRLIIFLFTDR